MSKVSKNKRLGRGLNSLLGGYSDDKPEESGKQETSQKAASSRIQRDSGQQEKKFHAEAAGPASATNQEKVPDAARIWKLAVDKIIANENQPRKEFEEEKLRELSASIKEQGILQPIVVRKLDKGYEIVSGERRWRAAQMAGLHDVPVIIRNMDEKRSLELAIIENVQRADLNAVEEAEAYYQLQKGFDLTQDQIAKRVGKDRATIANLLRLLQLHPEVRKLLASGEISQGHAKVLLSIEDAKNQKGIAKKAAAKKWSVRKLEQEIKKTKEKTKEKADDMNVDVPKQLAKAIGEDLQKIIGTKVEVDYSSGKGKISLHFYSDEQLSDLSDRMKQAWMQ